MTDLGIGSWPARRARIDPSAPAMREAGRERTYRELADDVDRLASVLASLGVARGDRVAFLGANSVPAYETFFATGRLGAIFAPFNTRLAAAEIGYLVGDCTPAVLVHDDEHADMVRALGTTCVSVRDLEARPAVGTAEAEVGLDDPAVVLYTSGTTGRPKGAVLTHGNLTFNTMNQLAHADILSTDSALCISPIFHATGLSQVGLPVLFKGGCLAVLPRFDAATVLRTIAEQRIASFSAVPTMLRMLADHPDFPATDLSSLRYVIYGGSMVDERVARAWQDRGVAILQGYGMTEASPGVTMATARGAPDRPTSIGVPHFFADVALRPLGDAQSVAQGELLVRGPHVFNGYWNRPADTAEILVDGWFHSGDVVRTDPDGWSYAVDRIKDLIISGGENVYPAEVEAALLSLPGIADAAVVAVPDEQWGEVGAAHLVLTGERPWTVSQVREALAPALAKFKIPRYVLVHSELPRTATGKVRRQELRDVPLTEGPA